MNPDLPINLRLACEQLLEGVVRRDLARRAGQISEAYRRELGSQGVIGDQFDATAYVLTRLPATYAACLRALVEAKAMLPEFAPTRLLDAGSGPGGSSWAALEAWPSLGRVMQIDTNAAFLNMSKLLSRQAHIALQNAEQLRADVTTGGPWPSADLVIASYALAEIPPARLEITLTALWAACEGLLVVIEPGTPAGWRRMLSARDHLIALDAQVIAPCPHAQACPILRKESEGDDWCHFSQRLPRSRDHRLAKGAEVPFEDEKFIYLAVSRPSVWRAEPSPRILAPPRMTKPALNAKLCCPDGRVEDRLISRRDKPAFAKARRLGWGDTLD